MKLFVVPALATLAAASNLARRADSGIDAIMDGIYSIGNQTQSLTNVVNTFSGKGSDAIGLQSTIYDLKVAVEDTAHAVENSEPLNTPDSTRLALAVLNLQPLIKASLDATVKQQPLFNQALPGVVNGIIGGDLEVLQEVTDELGAAIASKLSGEYATIAPTVQGQIDDSFKSAIHVYATGTNVPGGQPTGNAAVRASIPQFDPYSLGSTVFALVAAIAL